MQDAMVEILWRTRDAEFFLHVIPSGARNLSSRRAASRSPNPTKELFSGWKLGGGVIEPENA
jgi:hypothetical protein